MLPFCGRVYRRGFLDFSMLFDENGVHYYYRRIIRRVQLRAESNGIKSPAGTVGSQRNLYPPLGRTFSHVIPLLFCVSSGSVFPRRVLSCYGYFSMKRKLILFPFYTCFAEGSDEGVFKVELRHVFSKAALKVFIFCNLFLFIVTFLSILIYLYCNLLLFRIFTPALQITSNAVRL